MRAETIVFNGVKFRRYPDSTCSSDRNYYTPDGAHRLRGVGRLHQEIWKGAHGPIPEGFHIPHLDPDPIKNELSNLEALPEFDHMSGHGHDEPSLQARAHLERIRPLASEWHRSVEGHRWHLEHGQDSWVNREARLYTCQRCGREYQSLKISAVRFCCNACRAAWRRAIGADDEDRTCPVCGATF